MNYQGSISGEESFSGGGTAVPAITIPSNHPLVRISENPGSAGTIKQKHGHILLMSLKKKLNLKPELPT